MEITGYARRVIFPCLPLRDPDTWMLLGEKKKEEGKTTEKKTGYRTSSGARNDPLSLLGLKSGDRWEIFRAVSAWRAWRLFSIHIGDHTSHIFNTICVFSLRGRECAIIELRARLRGNCTLWVIACDKCSECPTFLRDVNGPDLGHRARATYTSRRDIFSFID